MKGPTKATASFLSLRTTINPMQTHQQRIPETHYTRDAIHVWPGGRPPPTYTNNVSHLVLDRNTGQSALMINTTVYRITDAPLFDRHQEWVAWARSKMMDGELLSQLGIVQEPAGGGWLPPN